MEQRVKATGVKMVDLVFVPLPVRFQNSTLSAFRAVYYLIFKSPLLLTRIRGERVGPSITAGPLHPDGFHGKTLLC